MKSTVRTEYLMFPALLVAATLISCSKPGPTAPPAENQLPETKATESTLPLIAACELLTSEEIASVQGEPVQMKKPSTPSVTGLALSQCYFALPTQSNSVVLTVTQGATVTAVPEVRKSWEQTFHGPAKEEVEGGKKKTPPEKIDGLGEEAFWVGSDLMGAVYALKGDHYLRVSVGGAGDAGSKLDKSKRLAELALGRLESAPRLPAPVQP